MFQHSCIERDMLAVFIRQACFQKAAVGVEIAYGNLVQTLAESYAACPLHAGMRPVIVHDKFIVNPQSASIVRICVERIKSI